MSYKGTTLSNKEGYKLLALDCAELELRVMAQLSSSSSDDAGSQGLDKHKATAAKIFGVELADVTDEQRRSAKAINFGLIYGSAADKLGDK
jgi:DNA polymerase-1